MDKITEIIRDDAKSVINRVNLSPLENKTVAVTGATGLIGTYIMAVLSTWGKCRLLCPITTEYPPMDTAAYQFCTDHALIRADLSKQCDQSMIPPNDFCFYGAGYGQPAKFTEQPLQTLAINTSGLRQALDALRFPAGRLLFASTSEIYSGHTKPPFREDEVGSTNPQHPRGCYIEAKRCGEAICSAYNSVSRRHIAIAARIALAYGPGTKKGDGRAINQFIRQALIDRKIVLKDAGQVIRNYCYITDTVEFILNAWLYGRYEVYNVGGKSKVTIAALARKIGEICNVPVEIPSTSGFDLNDAPDNVTLDMRLSEGEFRKTDYFPLEEGLRRTINWQRILYGQV